MKERRPKTRPAFTFVEVLVALAIAAIGLVGLLRLHLLSMTSADAAQAISEAVFVAQEKLAEASADGYPEQGTKSETIEQNGRRFTWQTDITPASSQAVRDLGLHGLRQIRAQVTWKQGASQKHVEMITYVADSEIHDSKRK